MDGHEVTGGGLRKDPPRAHRGTVLLVDDHELTGVALAIALRPSGCRCVTCAEPDVGKVLDLAHRHGADLAVVDLDFDRGGLDGLDLIAPLTGAGLPTLVLTGITDRAVHGQALEAGALGVVSKADGLDIVLEHVVAALDGDPVHTAAQRVEMFTASHLQRVEERRRAQLWQSLSPRQHEVLRRTSEGAPTEIIATELDVSVGTVRADIQVILRTLEVGSKLGAVARARQLGWLTADGPPTAGPPT